MRAVGWGRSGVGGKGVGRLEGGEECEGEKGGLAFDRKLSGNVEPDNQEEKVDAVISNIKPSVDANRSPPTAGSRRWGFPGFIFISNSLIQTSPRNPVPTSTRPENPTYHRSTDPSRGCWGIFSIQLTRMTGQKPSRVGLNPLDPTIPQ